MIIPQHILSIIVIVLCVVVFIMLFYIVYLQIKYNKLIKNTGEINIEKILIKNQQQIEQLNKFVDYFHDYEIKINDRLEKSVSKVAVKKYNALERMGGELSAIVCLLDELGSGVLLNILHTRDANHVFTKNIQKGKCDLPLSKDEKEVVNSLLKK